MTNVSPGLSSIVGAMPCMYSYWKAGKPVAGLMLAISETFATPWTALTTGYSGSSLTLESYDGGAMPAGAAGIGPVGPLVLPPQPASQASATKRAINRRMMRCAPTLELVDER